MRNLIAVALTVFAFACGSSPKHEGALVTEGSDTSPTCCCKTIPATAEKEIVPVYAMNGRMECSSNHGDCVDDVQCNNQGGDQQQGQTGGNTDGVPPPPPLAPSTNGSI